MIIELASVGTAPRSLTERLGREDIALDDEGRLLGDVEFTGELFRDGSKTHVKGAIRAEIELDCARCLEPVTLDLDVPFEDVFVDSSLEPTNDELEVREDDLDESLVIGGSVDMKEVIREQIILALPEMVFCGEDCRGLCDKCGTNLNLLDCKCKDDEIDPRWAALKNLN